ncbi:DUF3106 domain-containing protein [Arenimonas donghaensis]|uniref:RNA polymerase sigma factor 70 region 4 type 2 domain-containing protein n=1 Tax=Arenimonas donghaensis DSM 18148 = HO3-R19 TaxID=1121014 RepID=A0A087MKU5_9GAMM|nr:DUF3106 domain-containing protein [Arenimonas donghaensis]KFL37498.1 hypothetical protein N788_08925 [Arenimonas donghaensis DSM 18148 = HO3-R19]
MPASPTPSPALSAFLRGIERRAFVFAQVQSGNDDESLALVGRAMRAFRSVSTVTPLSGWPAGFWALLLAQGGLAAGEAPEPELSHLGAGPRAALLLRLVGGLDLAHAAQVLGVSEPTYRFALQRALQQLGEAGVSYAALGQLRERLHRQVKTLPAHHVEALAELRGRILRDEAEPPAVVAAPSSPWPRRLAWAGLVLLALAFAATWWEPPPPLLPGGVQDLPPETPVDSTVPMPGDASQVIHPDYPALADPDSEALAVDLAFLSWLAARDGSPPEPQAQAAQAADAAPLAAAQDQPAFPSLAAGERSLLAPLAGTWPQLDPNTRRQLIGQARHWLALDGEARAALRERLAQWDALPVADRAARRGHLAAWGNLSAAEQAWVRASAAVFSARPAEAQAAAREEFEALPAEARQAWWLGPALGEWFSPVQPLFAYMPEDQRPPLLAMLRDLSPQARADLALLARRLPATERERLRRELLDAPADQREALVHARLGR